MRRILVILLTLMTVGSASHLLAQKDEKAQSILDAMSNKYKEINAFKAKFEVELRDLSSDFKDTSKGEILVQGNKYHLTLTGQEIFNNEKEQWTYLVDEEEATVAEYDPDPDESLSSITDIYTIYQSGFKYRFVEDISVNGVKCAAIELNPEDRSVNYHTIRLEISQSDKTLKRWKIFEKTGRQYTYTIQEFTPNVQVTDADFVFNPDTHPDVDVVDLRDN